MCDPVSIIALGGAAVSGAASIYEGQQASSEIAATNKAQEDANSQWVAYQTRIHQQEQDADMAARQKGTAAQQDTLSKISPEAQEATQTTEQQRLNTLYNKSGAGSAQGGGAGVQGMELTGENTGNQSFKDSLTSQVNQATAQARGRIAALATAGSYGGSFGGLGTTVPITLAQGGNEINLQNAMRQGDLKTYGVEQQVQPIQYTVGPGTEAKASLAKGLGSLAGSLAGFGGPRLLGSMGGAAAGAAGASAGTVATNTMSPSDWAALSPTTFDNSWA